jgi:hypothetical protein
VLQEFETLKRQNFPTTKQGLTTSLPPWDLLVIDQTPPPLHSATPSTPSSLRSCRSKITHTASPDAGLMTSHPHPTPDLISSFVFYLRRRQGTYPSVVQNVLHHLGRPIYNCLEQSFHPGVSASDAPTALVGELIMAIASVVLMFIQSLNLLVILSCSEDLSATWLFNI